MVFIRESEPPRNVIVRCHGSSASAGLILAEKRCLIVMARPVPAIGTAAAGAHMAGTRPDMTERDKPERPK